MLAACRSANSTPMCPLQSSLSHRPQQHVFCLQACLGRGFAALLGKVPRSDLRSALLERLFTKARVVSPAAHRRVSRIRCSLAHRTATRAEVRTARQRQDPVVPYDAAVPACIPRSIISWPCVPLSVRRNQSTRCPSIAPSHSCGIFFSLRRAPSTPL